MNRYTFLVAIGTDELPSKILKKLGKDFSNYMVYEFKKNNICYDSVRWFAAPRHLAIQSIISVINHNDITNDNRSNQKVDKVILNKFIDNQVKCPESCDRYVSKENGNDNQNFKDLLCKIIKNVLGKFMNYETMRWGNIDTPFIRPVNTITVLLDSDLISEIFFDIKTDRLLYGHKFIKNNKIILDHASDYADVLYKKGFIIVDYSIRKKIIRLNVEKQAAKLGGIADLKDDNFLEEITALIEWPVVLFGRFEKKFLELPVEIIIHIMKRKQKYFPVYNIKNGVLLPFFIFVINTITDDYRKIILGHENVIRARFIDAEFFLKNDNKCRLEDYIPKLNSILFHRQLGSIGDKVNRIVDLSGWIAHQIGDDIYQAKRAGYLCKCDLVTDMVREFPEMQGIIGMYYAKRDGESKLVTLAQKEYYQPKYATDVLPTTQIACIVSIADKIDTISGIFGVKEFPTGSRDPFGLKRFADGILNIIIQKKISVNLFDLIYKSVQLYGSKLIDAIVIVDDIYDFMYKRLFACYYAQGYGTDIIKSVLKKTKSLNIISCSIQISVIDGFCKFKKKEMIKLHLIYKRILNILKKHNNTFFNTKKIKASLFKTTEEIQFFTQIIESTNQITLLMKNNQYSESLIHIIQLLNLTNYFLDHVMILNQNLDIQINRLVLLNLVKELVLKVIDFSVLQKTSYPKINKIG